MRQADPRTGRQAATAYVPKELDQLADALVFSEKCLLFYRRVFAPEAEPSQLANVIREQIRQDGVLIGGGLPGSASPARLRLPERFDIIFDSHPQVGSPIVIDGICVARSVRQRTKVRRGGRKERQRRQHRDGTRSASAAAAVSP